jgi:acetoin utilization deacetylase AcuC-like enzyme
MKTAVLHHPAYAQHETGEHHPDNPERYAAVMRALREDAELWGRLVEIEAPAAPRGDVQAAHAPQHLKRIEKTIEGGGTHLDPDTVVSLRSLDVALRGSGAACRAVDAVMTGEAQNAFVPVRPPGHHATRERAMGFCLLNTVAVAARYAQNRYKEIGRVAIIDWDVHHGNGTQGIFYDDPKVFFFSAHQYPWYPGTGARGETGQGRGRGYTLNVPLRALTPRADHRRAFDSALTEIAGKFTPDLIIISAGFDSHTSDPLGQLRLEDEDFEAMTRSVTDWAHSACAGRVVSCLEGGYNLDTLGASVRAHVRVLNDAEA